MNDRYYGDDAVKAAARFYGQKMVDPIHAHLIREEGFVPGTYLDSKGIETEGVGLTGEFKGKNLFKEVLPKFENRARKKVKGYDELPEEGRAAVLSAVYRGDLGPKAAELLSKGDYDKAAKEYLNHKEYRELKRKDPDSGIVSRMERNAAIFRSLGSAKP